MFPFVRVFLLHPLATSFSSFSDPSYRGNRKDTKGTAFVVYEDIYDAKTARERLQAFNVKDRYIIVLYHSQEAMNKKIDVEKKKKENDALRARLEAAQQ